VTGTEEDETPDPRQQLTAVAVKLLLVAISVGLVIGIGAWVMVKALGLDSAEVTDIGPGQVDPITPLPTTALPAPSGGTSPSAGSTDLPTFPTAPNTGGLYLSASPVFVKPMERINLTGQWPGHDNESVLVQRFEAGKWSDFGVQARVNLGTFETYVMTGHTGAQKFRVVDPGSGTQSNEVSVTVQS
jgi:hypothetical protein